MERDVYLSSVKELADTIRRDIQADPARVTLGSIGELGERYGKARQIVVAAIDLLRCEGHIAGNPDEEIRVARREATHTPPRHAGDPVELFAQLVRDRIVEGAYRVGTPLPKVEFFAAEYGVPQRTVRSALAVLAGEKLIHRKGRTWLVGAECRRKQPRYEPHPPVIAVVGPRIDSWVKLSRQERTTSFCRSFNEELEQNGILLMPVTPGSRFGENGEAGLAGLACLARELGDRYRGTVIAATLADIPTLAEWVKGCIGLGRPVVWFDRYNNEGLKEPIEHPLFLHCHFDEEAALRLAIDFLAQMGHRKAGYGYPFRWGSWERVRGERLQRIAPTVCPGFELVVPPALERLAPRMDTPGMREVIERFMQESSPVQEAIEHFLHNLDAVEEVMGPRGMRIDHESTVTRIISLLKFVVSGGDTLMSDIASKSQIHYLHFTPLFLHLMQDPDMHAVVAPNDAMARDLFAWIQGAGTSPGRELSLLSFDNYWALQPLAVTTIDFGFDNLGYAAFHFIQGDIPIHQSPPGHVPAKPHVVRRGSVKPLA